MDDEDDDQLYGSQDKRLVRELTEELGATHAHLAKVLVDLQEVTDTAMNVAFRLSACENTLAETRSELEGVRTVDMEELRQHSLAQADTIARQVAYINRLRTQVRHPGRIVAKRVLGPFVRVVGRDEKR